MSEDTKWQGCLVLTTRAKQLIKPHFESKNKFSELDELLNAFRNELKPGDVVLVKGSRSARMERFVENIR